MIPESSPLYRFADFVADAVNPLLALCLLGFLLVATRRREADWRNWLAAFLGIVLVYALRSIDKRADLWESFGGDYSTHSALAAAVIVPLLVVQPRLWAILLGVLLCYAALMMVLGFHTLLDIGTTLLVIVPLLVLLHRAIVRRSVSASAGNNEQNGSQAARVG